MSRKYILLNIVLLFDEYKIQDIFFISEEIEYFEKKTLLKFSF
jgi:hypothetical protein